MRNHGEIYWLDPAQRGTFPQDMATTITLDLDVQCLSWTKWKKRKSKKRINFI
jgi:hypothetical protein